MALRDIFPRTAEAMDQLPPQLPVSMPGGVPQLGTPPLRPVTSPRLGQEQQLQSRIDAFNNPQKPQGFWQNLRHIAATVGNVAGDIGLGQSTMTAIPGTQLNRQAQNERDVRALAGLQDQDLKETDAAQRRALEGAQTGEAEAKTAAIENPPDKPDQSALQMTDQGLFSIDKTTGQGKPVTYNGQPLRPPQKPDKEISPIQDLQNQILAAEQAGDRPTVQRLQQQLKDLNPMGEQRLGIQIAQMDQREGDRNKQQVLKAYAPALESGERFNVMSDSFEKGVRAHDQQAMLNLLANHLGMTMGLQKGTRMNQALINEAMKSRPWLQGMQAKFDKDGYLSGVTLSPPQMKQMVDLARTRFGEDTEKGRNVANYLGATDEGPNRTPSKSTINYYLSITNGDVNSAKDLARQDGWTIK